MVDKKIEELTPNHETVIDCLRLALMDLENQSYSDKDKISNAKHNVKDVLRRLGFTHENVHNPPKTLKL